MNKLLAVLVLVVCSSVVLCVNTSGFRANKKAAAHHVHHVVKRDLEQAAETQDTATAKVDPAAEIDLAIKDMETFKNDFEKVSKDLEAVKLHERTTLHALEEASKKAAEGEAGKPEEIVSDGLDSFQHADGDSAEDLSLLQLNVVDNMNNGAEDDDSVAPTVADRMKSKKGQPGETKVFGVFNDGSKRQFEVAKDGSTYVAPPPEVEDGFVKPNDAKYRTGDSTMNNVPVADVDPRDVHVDANMPGTSGKQWSLSAAQLTPGDDDSVCVCKRRGAPKKKEVICKRNLTPTPTPTPTPSIPKGIRQCVDGTWPADSTYNAGVNDTICVYYPATIPSPPTPTPVPSVTPYPSECYDPRNEYVAEGVVQVDPEDPVGVDKRRFDVLLIQQGYETCNC